MRVLNRLPLSCICLAIAGVGSTPIPAQAQWSATVLHPTGALRSEIWALAPGQQGGFVQLNSQEIYRGAIWGSGGSWIDLGFTGKVRAMTLSKQGGSFGPGACTWSGTPESRVSLHPAGSGVTGSLVLSLSSAQQSGYVLVNGEEHAAVWAGSAGSWVDLHPAGAVRSLAFATDGSRQWGGVDYSGSVFHAGYWSGTAASFVDLNPGPAWNSSIRGVGGGQQAGYLVPAGGLTQHAAVCSGTPSSWVDIHPYPGLGESQLYSTTGTVQVGWSHVPTASSPHAGVWFGTASSFIDLTQFLPAGFGGESIATCILQDQGRIYVGGFADGPNGQHQAVLWTYIPSPASTALFGAALARAGRRRARIRRP
jgi:hypothetical protein